jgi:hypothetical protein
MERYEDFEHFDPTHNYNANGGGTPMNEYMGAVDVAEGGLQGSIDEDQAGGNGVHTTYGRGNYGTADNALYQNEDNFGLFNKTAPYMEPSEMRAMPVLDDFGMSGLDPMSSKHASLTGGSKKKKKSKKKSKKKPKKKSKKKPKKKVSKKKVSKKKVSKKKVSKKKFLKKKVSKKKKDSVNKIKNFFDDLF